jgi:hypothetical protein
MWQSGKMNDEPPPGQFGGFHPLVKLESTQRRTSISISELLNPETPDSGQTLSAVSECHYQGDKPAAPGDKPAESPYAGRAAAQSHFEPEIGHRYTYSLPRMRRRLTLVQTPIPMQFKEETVAE